MLVFLIGYIVNIYVKPKYKKKAMAQYKQNIYNLIIDKNISSFFKFETSNIITNNVLQLNDITKVMITHRLDEKVLRNFDTILVIKNGKIHGYGTYDELIENNNLFKTLVELN